MAQFAVIKIGGKQYLVTKDQEIIIDRVPQKEGEELKLVTLAKFEDEKATVDLGTPYVAKQATAKVLEHLKGDKLRIAKFKAKVRYRKVTGFRAALSKLKILTV